MGEMASVKCLSPGLALDMWEPSSSMGSPLLSQPCPPRWWWLGRKTSHSYQLCLLTTSSSVCKAQGLLGLLGLQLHPLPAGCLLLLIHCLGDASPALGA